MGLSESDTRAKLIDPAIHARGWTEELIRREETTGAIQVIDGKPRKQAKGRVDCILRVKVNRDTQPVAVALIEAESLPPNHGLERAEAFTYKHAKWLASLPKPTAATIGALAEVRHERG